MIHFVKDDFIEADLEKLNRVVETVNLRPKEYEAKAVFLRNFVDGLVVAATKTKRFDKLSKTELEIKKEEVKKKLFELKTSSETNIKDKVMKLIRLKGVKEVVCDGPKEKIKLVHKDGHTEESEIEFEDVKRLNEFVVYLAGTAGVHVDFHRPFLNRMINNEIHVQATFGTDYFKPKFVIHKIS